MPSCTVVFDRICDEQLNDLGPSTCQEDLDCSLGRKCINQECTGRSAIRRISCPRRLETTANEYCQGTILPPCSEHVSRACEESQNELGPSICENNDDCASGRVCGVTNLCEGSANLKVIDCSLEPAARPALTTGETFCENCTPEAQANATDATQPNEKDVEYKPEELELPATSEPLQEEAAKREPPMEEDKDKVAKEAVK